MIKKSLRAYITTGEFHFPHALAAEIATQTILHYQQTHQNRLKVIFNVFKDKDYELYKRKPDCFAVKQYRKFKLSSGDVCSK